MNGLLRPPKNDAKYRHAENRMLEAAFLRKFRCLMLEKYRQA
jgi:hypothetical protein